MSLWISVTLMRDGKDLQGSQLYEILQEKNETFESLYELITLTSFGNTEVRKSFFYLVSCILLKKKCFWLFYTIYLTKKLNFDNVRLHKIFIRSFRLKSKRINFSLNIETIPPQIWLYGWKMPSLKEEILVGI